MSSLVEMQYELIEKGFKNPFKRAAKKTTKPLPPETDMWGNPIGSGATGTGGSMRPPVTGPPTKGKADTEQAYLNSKRRRDARLERELKWNLERKPMLQTKTGDVRVNRNRQSMLREGFQG